MKLAFVGIAVVLLALAAYGINRASTAHDPMVTFMPSPISSPVSTEPDNEIVRELQQGGSSYTDAKGIFTMLYPSDYVLDLQGNGQYIRITKKGATQRGQTEIYDGVLIVFEPIDLKGMSLTQFVDTRIAEVKGSDTSQLVKDRTPVTVGSYSGYEYVIRSLGESTYTVLQKDSSSAHAVVISRLVADPEEVGYQKEVDAVIQTLQFLK